MATLVAILILAAVMALVVGAGRWLLTTRWGIVAIGCGLIAAVVVGIGALLHVGWNML